MRQAILLVHADRLSDKMRKRNKRVIFGVWLLKKQFAQTTRIVVQNKYKVHGKQHISSKQLSKRDLNIKFK